VASCATGTTQPSICTLRPDGSEVRVLADPGYELLLPRWAPDGSTIAAFREEPGATLSTWLLDPAGGRPPRRAAGAALPFDGQTAPGWSGPRLLLGEAPTAFDPSSGALTALPGVGPGRQVVACGPEQVLYRTAVAFGPAQAGDLVVVGVDGSRPAVVLPKARSTELIPTSCAAR
jgi:hypothetical protein